METIIEFREHTKFETTKFLKTSEGEHKVSNETIRKLWWGWLTHPLAERRDTEHYTVYGFSSTVDYKEFLIIASNEYEEMLNNN